MGTIRTLVLSGGGGRGAFHAGVFKYLSQLQKTGVDDSHQGAWEPEIIVGTSIGAVNGAAIAQGFTAGDLESFWLGVREHDIEGLPPGMSGLTRFVTNRVLRQLIGVPLPRVLPGDSTAVQAGDTWPVPGLGRFGAWLLGRWASLLDTGPLRRTLVNRMGLEESSIARSERTLLINATRISTGERATFSNRPIRKRSTGEDRSDVQVGITIPRILASCSIPMVYPWTIDPASGHAYWDGAVVANTPLGCALDAAAGRPTVDPMEVVVVLMTPWRNAAHISAAGEHLLPRDFSEAVTWALDWLLLASFRERVGVIEAYNRLARQARELGHPELAPFREVKIVIVAPQDFFPAARILDYDLHNKELIRLGCQSAEQAFREQFPAAT